MRGRRGWDHLLCLPCGSDSSVGLGKPRSSLGQPKLQRRGQAPSPGPEAVFSLSPSPCSPDVHEARLLRRSPASMPGPGRDPYSVSLLPSASPFCLLLPSKSACWLSPAPSCAWSTGQWQKEDGQRPWTTAFLRPATGSHPRPPVHCHLFLERLSVRTVMALAPLSLHP